MDVILTFVIRISQGNKTKFYEIIDNSSKCETTTFVCVSWHVHVDWREIDWDDYGRMRMQSSRPVHMTFNSFGKKMETLTSPQEIELIIVFRRILMVEISFTSTWPLTLAILNNTQCEFPKCHSFTPFKLGLIRLKLNFLSRSLIFFPSIHSLISF